MQTNFEERVNPACVEAAHDVIRKLDTRWDTKVAELEQLI